MKKITLKQDLKQNEYNDNIDKKIVSEYRGGTSFLDIKFMTGKCNDYVIKIIRENNIIQRTKMKKSKIETWNQEHGYDIHDRKHWIRMRMSKTYHDGVK